MDPNRRSGVSSYYSDAGARRPSRDALAAGHQPQPSSSSLRYGDASSPTAPGFDDGVRRDSSATLFNTHPRAGTPGGGGYNQASYSHVGREEPVKGSWDEEEEAGLTQKEEGWDVYADFNNAGPKYSSTYSSQHAYQPLGTPGMKGEGDETTLSGPGNPGQVELVTVPALGPEWKADELRDMTSAGKRERKAEKRAVRFNDWRRNRSGLCGIPWLTRQALTFIVFGLIIAAGITLAFTIPRVPGFALSADAPLANATGDFASSVPTLFVRAPSANFSFPAVAQLRIDTQSSFLALKMKNLKAEVYDSGTKMLVGTGNIASQTLAAKSYVPLQLPLNFSYAAVNDSDQTWLDWYNACRNPQATTDGKRPGINFTLILSFNIFGLFGTKRTSTDVLNAGCPIVLPVNSA